jgi:hypothetical protein
MRSRAKCRWQVRKSSEQWIMEERAEKLRRGYIAPFMGFSFPLASPKSDIPMILFRQGVALRITIEAVPVGNLGPRISIVFYSSQGYDWRMALSGSQSLQFRPDALLTAVNGT